MYSDKQKKALELLDKYFSETPEEQIRADVEEISALNIPGPTVSEYFKMIGFNPEQEKLNHMSNLQRVILVFDDHTKIVEGEEATKWENQVKSAGSILHGRAYNPFADPINWTEQRDDTHEWWLNNAFPKVSINVAKEYMRTAFEPYKDILERVALVNEQPDRLTYAFVLKNDYDSYDNRQKIRDIASYVNDMGSYVHYGSPVNVQSYSQTLKHLIKPIEEIQL